MSSKPLIAYWDIRGLVSPIKLLLEYANVDYEDKRYTCGPPPDFKNDWFDTKFKLGLDFPNLPYYIEGDLKLTQSGVILRYLARKHNLVAKNEADLLRVELIEAQFKDIHTEFVRAFYNPDFANVIKGVVEGMPAKLKQVEEFLGDRSYFAGDYITYVDFYVFEILEVIKAFDEKLLAGVPRLVAYHKRISELPAIDKYFKSDRAIKFPFNGAPARWGGKYSDLLNK